MSEGAPKQSKENRKNGFKGFIMGAAAAVLGGHAADARAAEASIQPVSMRGPTMEGVETVVPEAPLQAGPITDVSFADANPARIETPFAAGPNFAASSQDAALDMRAPSQVSSGARGTAERIAGNFSPDEPLALKVNDNLSVGYVDAGFDNAPGVSVRFGRQERGERDTH